MNWEPPHSHDINEPRQKVGVLMQELKASQTEHEMKDFDRLEDLASYLKYPLKDLQEDYDAYLKLLAQRQDRIERSRLAQTWWQWTKSFFTSGLADVPNITRHFNLWGSIRQLKCGKVVCDTLYEHGVTECRMHPIFGALLNPTGGMVGAGEDDLEHLIPGTQSHRTAPVMHAIVHDAAGYCYNYHGVGPGYNYTGGWTLFPTGKPFSGQGMGLALWRAFLPWSVKDD